MTWHAPMTTAASVTLFVIGASLILLRLTNHQLLSVQSASMAPTFQPGDALLVEPISTKQLSPGNIVAYRSALNFRVIITHRVISVNSQHSVITTAGDAQGIADPPVTEGQLVGQATAVAPKLGRVIDFIRTPAGLLIAVYMPAFIIILNEVKRLLLTVRHPRYRLISAP